MKTLLLAASSLAATAAFALGPRIDPATVSLTQDRARLVTVKYTLENCPGIVTLDFQTNRLNAATTDEADWVSIGGENVQGVEGDVNRLVTELGEHTLTWQPRELWPDHKTKTGAFRAVVTVWATNAPPDYLVVDLKASSNLTYYADASFIPRGGITNDYYKQDAIVMRLIKAKGRSWMMGSPLTEYNRESNEAQHKVILTNDYYMAIYQFTRGQCTKFVDSVTADKYVVDGKNIWISPSSYGTPEPPENSTPICSLSYDVMRGPPADYNWPLNRHAVKPERVLGRMRAKTGVDFDLPTEAQWEYACRAGTSTSTYNGELTSSNYKTILDPIAWNNANYGGTYRYHVVGQLKQNAWGLYDMLGNGQEACLDYYAADYGATDLPFEPEGPTEGSARSWRGGDSVLYGQWWHNRAAFRLDTVHNSMATARLVCPVALTYPESEK